MDVDDEHETRARALQTQAPVPLAQDWVLLDEDTCLAWLEVRLHRPGALLMLHVAHQTGAEHDPHALLRLSRWREEDEVDVEVEFLVDGEPAGHGSQDRPDRDGTEPTRPIRLLQAGGRSTGGKSEQEWWLPQHPRSELVVTVRWADRTRRASVTVDTSGWSDLAAGVRTLGAARG